MILAESAVSWPMTSSYSRALALGFSASVSTCLTTLEKTGRVVARASLIAKCWMFIKKLKASHIAPIIGYPSGAIQCGFYLFSTPREEPGSGRDDGAGERRRASERLGDLSGMIRRDGGEHLGDLSLVHASQQRDHLLIGHFVEDLGYRFGWHLVVYIGHACQVLRIGGVRLGGRVLQVLDLGLEVGALFIERRLLHCQRVRCGRRVRRHGRLRFYRICRCLRRSGFQADRFEHTGQSRTALGDIIERYQ